MKFLTAILDSLVAFVQRNPLTVLVILLLALGAPALLKGIATMILYAILGLLLFGAVLLVVLGWRVRTMQRRMEEQLNDRFGGDGQRNTSSGHGGFWSSWGRASSHGREGEVHVYTTSGTPEKRVSKDVGDYVEFEETRSENTD